MKRALINFTKLGLAGASIVAIGAIMLTISPEAPTQGVSEANADIFDLVSSKAISDTIFSRIMDDAGMQPRPFDYNGNVVNFGAMNVVEEPQDAMLAFQRKFVDEGINRRVHHKTMMEYGIGTSMTEDQMKEYVAATKGEPNAFTLTPEQEVSSQLAADYLNGEIMPVARHEDFISMAGIIPKNRRADDLKPGEFPSVWEKNEQGVIDPRLNSDGFRYMDFSKTVDKKSTSVTAVWADKDFDARKTDPTYKGNDTSVDKDIPSCVGCSRMFRIDGLNEETDPFTTNQFYSFSDRESVETFYTTAMSRRGWKTSTAQVHLERLFQEIPSLQKHDGKMLFMERDGERLELMLQPMDDGGTMVTTMQEHQIIGLPDAKP